VQLVALESALKLPGAQWLHTRSVLLVPSLLTYVPAAHELQLLQVDALVAVLKVPLEHFTQLRLEVAEPAELTA
jgi:hypothetical protein